jgi:hypothetical protein
VSQMRPYSTSRLLIHYATPGIQPRGYRTLLSDGQRERADEQSTCLSLHHPFPYPNTYHFALPIHLTYVTIPHLSPCPVLVWPSCQAGLNLGMRPPQLTLAILPLPYQITSPKHSTSENKNTTTASETVRKEQKKSTSRPRPDGEYVRRQITPCLVQFTEQETWGQEQRYADVLARISPLLQG